jgi:hypothetical protein
MVSHLAFFFNVCFIFLLLLFFYTHRHIVKVRMHFFSCFTYFYLVSYICILVTFSCSKSIKNRFTIAKFCFLPGGFAHLVPQGKKTKGKFMHMNCYSSKYQRTKSTVINKSELLTKQAIKKHKTLLHFCC